MQTQMVNFAIPQKILAQADQLAKKESRSRSELFREAIRRYLEEQKREKEYFERIRRTAAKIDMDENEALSLVEKVRDSLLLNK